MYDFAMVARKYWFNELWDLLNADMFNYTMSKCCICYHQSYEKKMHKNWEAVKFMVVAMSVPNSNFHLFAQMLSLATTTLSCFS